MKLKLLLAAALLPLSACATGKLVDTAAFTSKLLPQEVADRIYQPANTCWSRPANAFISYRLSVEKRRKPYGADITMRAVGRGGHEHPPTVLVTVRKSPAGGSLVEVQENSGTLRKARHRQVQRWMNGDAQCEAEG